MKSPICEMLGIDFPLLAFSHCRDVVAAVSRAGGFGFTAVSSTSAICCFSAGMSSSRTRPTRMQSAMHRSISACPSQGKGCSGEYEISQVNPKPPGGLQYGLALPSTKMRWNTVSSG